MTTFSITPVLLFLLIGTVYSSSLPDKIKEKLTSIPGPEGAESEDLLEFMKAKYEEFKGGLLVKAGEVGNVLDDWLELCIGSLRREVKSLNDFITSNYNAPSCKDNRCGVGNSIAKLKGMYQMRLNDLIGWTEDCLKTDSN